jgi:hypothetical protein
VRSWRRAAWAGGCGFTLSFPHPPHFASGHWALTPPNCAEERAGAGMPPWPHTSPGVGAGFSEPAPHIRIKSFPARAEVPRAWRETQAEPVLSPQRFSSAPLRRCFRSFRRGLHDVPGRRRGVLPCVSGRNGVFRSARCKQGPASCTASWTGKRDRVRNNGPQRVTGCLSWGTRSLGPKAKGCHLSPFR